MAEQMPEVLRLAAKAYLRLFVFSPTKAKLYVCVPATDLIFHYSDSLVKKLYSDRVLKGMGQSLPLDHISLQQNNSINDTYLSIIHTGIDDTALTGQFVQWDGREELDLWPGKTANGINGTEGLIFKPLLEEGEDLEAFVDDVYRSFPLVYINTSSVLGLDVFRYELPNTVFQSAYQNPANARWGSWCPNGLFYLGAVQVRAMSLNTFISVAVVCSSRVHKFPCLALNLVSWTPTLCTPEARSTTSFQWIHHWRLLHSFIL